MAEPPQALAPEPAERLAAARRQPTKPRRPPAGPRERFRTALAIRRLLPSGLVVRRAERSAQRRWSRSPGSREKALVAMQAVVRGTSREADAPELARLYLVERAAAAAMYWQPWEKTRMSASALDLLRGAVGHNRGVLLSCCHMGPFFHMASIGEALGRHLFTVGGAWCFEPLSNDLWGRRVARRWEGLAEHDGRLIPAAGSFPLLKALLEDGEMVALHFDVAGPHATRFLSKPAMLTDGTARLAQASGALVVPVRMRREGHVPWMDVHAPLDPHGFSEPGDLHEALAAIHERWILQLPHTLENPLRAGGWAAASAP